MSQSKAWEKQGCCRSMSTGSASSMACMNTDINSGFILLSSLSKHEKCSLVKISLCAYVQWGSLQQLGWICPVPGSCTPVTLAVLALGIKSPTLLADMDSCTHPGMHKHSPRPARDSPGSTPKPVCSQP